MHTVHFETVDSTSYWLKRNYRDLEDMTFVSADFQSQGHGRMGRKWEGEAGRSLMFSLLIKDQDLLEKYSQLSCVSALSIIQVLERQCEDHFSIKWPNDIYVLDRKICGILLEAVSRDSLECIIIGCGINVNQREFPGEYLHPPVSLYQLLNRETDISELKEEIYHGLKDDLDRLASGWNFYPEIRERDYLKGRTALAEIDGHKRPVKVEGINEDCSLKLSYQGQTVNVSSGEITFHVQEDQL